MHALSASRTKNPALIRPVLDRLTAGRGLLARRLERVLKDEQVAAALEDPTCVVRVITRAGRWVFVGPNAADLLGVDPEAAAGRNVFDFIPAPDAAQVRDLVDIAGECRARLWYRTGSGGTFTWVRTDSMLIEGLIVGFVRPETDVREQYVHWERLE